jgi:alcohol dehydrogenase (cytochrome c)
MFERRLLWWSLAVAIPTALLPATAGAADPPAYSPVTEQRLTNPEPQNWLMYRRTYDGAVYSPLNKINAGNVANLVPVWTFATGVTEGHEAPPIVNNGVMFAATPQGQVLALDAKTGDLIWRYKRKLPEDLSQLHPTSRGVGLWQDKVYFASTDAYLVALDAKTGKEVWAKPIGDYKKGPYMTLAPQVIKGKVLVGSSGGELGVRGYVVAFDAQDGKELWRTYTIPGPGEPGHDTWKGDDWKTGGGSVWMTGNYDPATNLAYWGVGNAAPWPGDAHPGDNLYTSSVIAIDPDTGKIKNHHQYHYNDAWDWDEVDPPILADLKVAGRDVKGLIHPGRNGYLWVLERGADKINFVAANPFVLQNVFTKVDPKTGRPEYDPAKVPAVGKTVTFCPSLWGGKDWPSASYSPPTGLLFIPANDNMCGKMVGEKKPYVEGQLWLGADVDKLDLSRPQPPGSYIGELQAWDVAAGKKVWSQKFPQQLFASVLSTAGDLVFVGGTNDRYFRAFDAKTGKLLWQQKTNSGIMGMPVAYEVDGVQYIAVQSGWGVDGQRIQDSLAKIDPSVKPDVPQGGVVWVFALKQ